MYLPQWRLADSVRGEADILKMYGTKNAYTKKKTISYNYTVFFYFASLLNLKINFKLTFKIILLIFNSNL